MKHHNPLPPSSGTSRSIPNIWRHASWLTENLTARKTANLLLATTEFALRREVMRAWPVLAKVDISPLCNLRCTMCVHARPSDTSSKGLHAQRFRAGQVMSIDRYREVVSQLAGRTATVSLSYVGDPMMHPHLDEICGVTREAGINSHVSTNFSFGLSDERLRSIVKSGLTHLRVCVDGLTQEMYGRTRVGGKLALVMENLQRLLRIRGELGSVYPRVEVQYIKYRHNVAQVGQARGLFRSWGVDLFTEMWGILHNVTDTSGDVLNTSGPLRRRVVPRCMKPFMSILVRYDGGALPCACHRQAHQYTEGSDAERRELGNVFDDGVWAVWNSPAYRALRRLSANPQRALAEPALAHTFCEKCPELYATDVDRYFRRANAHAWEDMYQQDDRGRVTRKPLVQLGPTPVRPQRETPVDV